MTKTEKAKAILRLVDDDLKSALSEKLQTYSAWQAAQTGYRI